MSEVFAAPSTPLVATALGEEPVGEVIAKRIVDSPPSTPTSLFTICSDPNCPSTELLRWLTKNEHERATLTAELHAKINALAFSGDDNE